MNKSVTALLILSVVVAASALAVRDQNNQRGPQTFDENIPSQYPFFPLGERGGNDNEANEISSDDIESVRRKLQALEQRNIDALQNAPRAQRTTCETVKECTAWVYKPRECVNTVFWVCVEWREARTECKDEHSYRWVTRCRKPHKRSNVGDSPVDSKSDELQTESTKDSEKVDTLDEKETEIRKLQSESLTTFRDVYKLKVVKAEKYESPAITSGENVNSEVENVAAVIVTLTDGRRYAIAWGRGLWDDNSSAVLNADHVTDDLQLIESKNIQFSTVADYVQASDSSTSYGEAAEKMMKLE